MHNGPFGKRRNSIAVFRAQEAGTQEQSVVIIIIIIIIIYNLFIHGKIYSSYKKDNKLILILILVYKIAVWGLVYSSKYLLTAFLNLACV
jgi:hypothetical protein